MPRDKALSSVLNGADQLGKIKIVTYTIHTNLGGARRNHVSEHKPGRKREMLDGLTSMKAGGKTSKQMD